MNHEFKKHPGYADSCYHVVSRGAHGHEDLRCELPKVYHKTLAPMTKHTTELYFECHITVDPVYDVQLECLQILAAGWRFKVADLLMRKRLEDTPERSQFDTFLTGRGNNFEDLYRRMIELVKVCEEQGFKVWRYKIENTLLDVRLPK